MIEANDKTIPLNSNNGWSDTSTGTPRQRQTWMDDVAEPRDGLKPGTSKRRRWLPEAKPPTPLTYRSPAEVAGRSPWELLYFIVLLLSAGADIAAFHQVVSLVMPNEEDWLILVLVLGLTACALALAHFGGRLARDIAAGLGKATWRSVLWCAVPWALLGISAVIVRMVVASSTSDGFGLEDGSEGDNQFAAAMLFAMLYFASGMLAGIGEFFSRNPLRAGYRRLRKAHRKAYKRLRKSQPAYERAAHVYELHRVGLLQDDASYAAARAQRLAHAEQLKRYSAVLIAAHLRDPSATDGMTEPDWQSLSAAAHRPSSN